MPSSSNILSQDVKKIIEFLKSNNQAEIVQAKELFETLDFNALTKADINLLLNSENSVDAVIDNSIYFFKAINIAYKNKFLDKSLLKKYLATISLENIINYIARNNMKFSYAVDLYTKYFQLLHTLEEFSIVEILNLLENNKHIAKNHGEKWFTSAQANIIDALLKNIQAEEAYELLTTLEKAHPELEFSANYRAEKYSNSTLTFILKTVEQNKFSGFLQKCKDSIYLGKIITQIFSHKDLIKKYKGKMSYILDQYFALESDLEQLKQQQIVNKFGAENIVKYLAEYLKIGALINGVVVSALLANKESHHYLKNFILPLVIYSNQQSMTGKAIILNKPLLQIEDIKLIILSDELVEVIAKSEEQLRELTSNIKPTIFYQWLLSVSNPFVRKKLAFYIKTNLLEIVNFELKKNSPQIDPELFLLACDNDVINLIMRIGTARIIDIIAYFSLPTIVDILNKYPSNHIDELIEALPKAKLEVIKLLSDSQVGISIVSHLQKTANRKTLFITSLFVNTQTIGFLSKEIIDYISDDLLRLAENKKDQERDAIAGNLLVVLDKIYKGNNNIFLKFIIENGGEPIKMDLIAYISADFNNRKHLIKPALAKIAILKVNALTNFECWYTYLNINQIFECASGNSVNKRKVIKYSLQNRLADISPENLIRLLEISNNYAEDINLINTTLNLKMWHESINIEKRIALIKILFNATLVKNALINNFTVCKKLYGILDDENKVSIYNGCAKLPGVAAVIIKIASLKGDNKIKQALLQDRLILHSDTLFKIFEKLDFKQDFALIKKLILSAKDDDLFGYINKNINNFNLSEKTALINFILINKPITDNNQTEISYLINKIEKSDLLAVIEQRLREKSITNELTIKILTRKLSLEAISTTIKPAFSDIHANVLLPGKWAKIILLDRYSELSDDDCQKLVKCLNHKHKESILKNKIVNGVLKIRQAFVAVFLSSVDILHTILTNFADKNHTALLVFILHNKKLVSAYVGNSKDHLPTIWWNKIFSNKLLSYEQLCRYGLLLNEMALCSRENFIQAKENFESSIIVNWNLMVSYDSLSDNKRGFLLKYVFTDNDKFIEILSIDQLASAIEFLVDSGSKKNIAIFTAIFLKIKSQDAKDKLLKAFFTIKALDAESIFAIIPGLSPIDVVNNQKIISQYLDIKLSGYNEEKVLIRISEIKNKLIKVEHVQKEILAKETAIKQMEIERIKIEALIAAKNQQKVEYQKNIAILDDLLKQDKTELEAFEKDHSGKIDGDFLRKNTNKNKKSTRVYENLADDVQAKILKVKNNTNILKIEQNQLQALELILTETNATLNTLLKSREDASNICIDLKIQVEQLKNEQEKLSNEQQDVEKLLNFLNKASKGIVDDKERERKVQLILCILGTEKLKNSLPVAKIQDLLAYLLELSNKPAVFYLAANAIFTSGFYNKSVNKNNKLTLFEWMLQQNKYLHAMSESVGKIGYESQPFSVDLQKALTAWLAQDAYSKVRILAKQYFSKEAKKKLALIIDHVKPKLTWGQRIKVGIAEWASGIPSIKKVKASSYNSLPGIMSAIGEQNMQNDKTIIEQQSLPAKPIELKNNSSSIALYPSTSIGLIFKTTKTGSKYSSEYRVK